MELLITNDDRAMHEMAKLRLRTGPDYNLINNEDLYLLQFVYVLIANAKLTYQHGCDAFASEVLVLPHAQPDDSIEAKLRKILDEKIAEPYDLLVSTAHGMTNVLFEVNTNNPDPT